jgi:hypothetical protein
LVIPGRANEGSDNNRLCGAGLLGAAVSVSLWLYFSRSNATTPLSPDAFRDRINPDVFRERVSPESFKDGIGIYIFNNNQYNMLIWKKTLIGPRCVEEKDVMEAYQQAAIVKKRRSIL